MLAIGVMRRQRDRRTELEVWLLLLQLATLLVGEDHVGRETTLGRVGVWSCYISIARRRRWQVVDSPFLAFLAGAALASALALRGACALGIVKLLD